MDTLFRTSIKIKDDGWKINYSHSLFFIGSCFADSIGSMLVEHKYKALCNPLGVMYNPISVANVINRMLGHRELTRNNLFLYNGLWHSFDLHGMFSSPDPENVLEKANGQIDRGHQFLKECDYLFVTFGTAWIYQNSSTQEIVANCHKLPDWDFTRRKLSVEEIVQTWNQLLGQLNKLNPKLKVVFTVSPIRHLKDGAHENQLSKSTLFLAIDELVKKSQGNTMYFPSYELVMDELRDYRFYASDMIHLSDVAIDFIYDKFSELFFDADTLALSAQVEKITQAAKHIFLQNNKPEIEKFAVRQIKAIEYLEQLNGFINFTEEKEHFERLIFNKYGN